MKTNYLSRLKNARREWINADAKNPEHVKEAYAQYVQALTNYRNSRGTK